MSSLSTSSSSLPPLPLPPSITSRQIDLSSSSGFLNYHILESGFTPTNSRPLILLLHGFPELAFSWRKVLPRLADAGYYAVAPDQRGFGRTTGWDARGFDQVDLSTFSLTHMVRDILVLVNALGYSTVRCVVGHDAGAVTAALCALIRPDIFQSVALMSHPFNGTPALPFNVANDEAAAADAWKNNKKKQNSRKNSSSSGSESAASTDVHAELAAQGRKHYKWYYSTARANDDMTSPPQGLHQFLRGYFHLKSASWAGNDPHPLRAWTASELAQLPYYYIMPLDATMPEAVRLDMAKESDEAKRLSHSWLPDADLAVYVAEYARTTFQGGLNWYRVRTAEGGRLTRDFDLFAGQKLQPPCAFIGGKKDWGTYQEPGAIDKMVQGVVCADFRVLKLIHGAGHWIPQEKPEEVVEGILELVRSLD
jgi:pimeloyl-ACP methyl ester carboxylesterase